MHIWYKSQVINSCYIRQFSLHSYGAVPMSPSSSVEAKNALCCTSSLPHATGTNWPLPYTFLVPPTPSYFLELFPISIEAHVLSTVWLHSFSLVGGIFSHI
jgi:hypothetical protein